ncbi:MAG: carbohydrate binding domain-containing protein, partial [Elusimicrobiota bacterium]
VSHRRELKTYYSIGQSNIVRDNGNGNFILKVQDLNRNAVGSSLNPRQLYPDTIEVDFEQGIFRLQNHFASESDPSIEDPQIYSAAPGSKRVIRVEYSFRFKTFLLEPGIVLQSEVVRVDGRKLGRNEEYFIDYDSGFITFYYPERMGQDSRIEIVYEVSPFGGVGNQSLVGGRVSYDFGGHFSVGSTLLYQGGIKSNTVPNITDLTNSMMVYEGDAQLKGLNLFGLKASLGAEAAQSRLNPNLNDYALIDNMEGVKQEDSPSMDKNFWFIAANPTRSPALPPALDWYNENIKSTDINSASASEGTQQVLTVKYDFTVSPEVSIVYPLSTTGLDFSQKNVLELVVYGQKPGGLNGPEFNIHLGQISEDADNTGGERFSCASGLVLTGAPDSEDLNCDGQVSSAEDIGWLYAPVSTATKRYGAGNGRLDSEDLNKNGRLDAQDFTGGSFGYVTGSEFTDNNDTTPSPGNRKNTINFDGWRTLYLPLTITSTDTFKWNAIKQVRISLRKKSPGDADAGVVKFARISTVGNTWTVQSSTNAGSIQAIGVNNQDNPGYTPIHESGGDATIVFNNLYGSASEQKQKNNSRALTEQTLALNYDNIYSTSTVYVYRKFTTAIDISQHETLRFLVKSESGNDPTAGFYIKAGDVNNYFKASVPLNFTGWRLITINQEDITGDKIPDSWVPSTSGVEISSRGTPSLQQVPQFIVGIEARDGNSHAGTVYFNELHMAAPLTRIGNARKVEGSFEIPGWFSFGGKHRFMDRSFQTPVTAIANQDNEQHTGYLNITRLAFFPVNVTAARQITVTPNTLATGSNNLVNSLQQGRVKKFDGTASGSINIGALPRLGLNYSKGITDYSLLSRKDDRALYAANLAYSAPGSAPVLPRSINLNYSLGNSKVNYDASRLLVLTGLYETEERTDAYGARLAFVPWNGASFNPGY